MCADRGNDRVGYLYEVYQPAVLRSLKRIIEEGNKAGIMVGMCGEAAADPLLIPVLLSFGLGEFSVSAPSILRTRRIISEWSKADADALTEKVMQLKTATEVKAMLQAACPLGHSLASCFEPNEAPQVTWPWAPLCLRVTAGRS